jgi:hypothetical protein
MPTQYKIDDIIVDNEQGIATFQVGPYGFSRELTWLFDRSNFEPNHMIKNLRLAHKIGAKADVASREFLDSVNGGNKGMDLADGTWFIRKVALSSGSEDTYEISFSITKTGPISHTITTSRTEFENNESPNPENILDNVRSFLRRGNFSSLTAGAISALKNTTFWA